MSRTYDVYGLGNALVDIEYEVEDAFLAANDISKGQMTLVEADRQRELMQILDGFEPRRGSGGSAANTLIGVSGFGGRAYYSCKVADDELGRFFVRDLLAAGVDTNADQHHGDGDSGRCLVLLTPDAERTMNTFLGISGSLSRANVNEEALADSKWLYMEGYLCTSDSARDALVEAHDLARDTGVRVAATLSDPSMPEFFAPQLRAMLGDHVDHLFCNAEEALLWTGEKDEAAAVEALKDFAGTFAITRGGSGSLVWDGATLHDIPTEPVRAVDTLGAGDLYAGAYLYALGRGDDHRAAGELANRAATRLVTHFGPRLPIDALRALIAA
jgi:fructokinase